MHNATQALQFYTASILKKHMYTTSWQACLKLFVGKYVADTKDTRGKLSNLLAHLNVLSLFKLLQ